jgi:hypothetical protein
MLNYGQNADDLTIAWLRERNPAIKNFVGRWSEQFVRARELSKQDRISTSNMQIVNGQIHQFIDQVISYFLKRSIFACQGV